MFNNKPFKNYVRELFQKHIDENLKVYIEGILYVTKRRILITKWLVDAWEKRKKQPDMIKHSSLKCGLSNNLDGTEDDQTKIRVIVDYKMSSTEREFPLLEDDEESGSETKFTEVDADYSNDLSESESELELD